MSDIRAALIATKSRVLSSPIVDEGPKWLAHRPLTVGGFLAEEGDDCLQAFDPSFESRHVIGGWSKARWQTSETLLGVWQSREAFFIRHYGI
jgi:hypothetical protein